MTELKEKEGGIHYILYIGAEEVLQYYIQAEGGVAGPAGIVEVAGFVGVAGTAGIIHRKKKIFFSFFALTPSRMWLKRPVYRGFKGEGRCEGRAFTLTPALTLPSHFRHRKVSCQGFYLQNLTKVPEKYSYLVPTVQHRYTNSIAMLHYQYSYAGLSV